MRITADSLERAEACSVGLAHFIGVCADLGYVEEIEVSRATLERCAKLGIKLNWGWIAWLLEDQTKIKVDISVDDLFSGADLTGLRMSNLRPSQGDHIVECNFTNASLHDIEFAGTFTDCKFVDADLIGGRISSFATACTFERCDFSGVRHFYLVLQSLERVRFIDCVGLPEHLASRNEEAVKR